MNLIDMLDMGDYGAYVWSCYGLVFGVLMLNVWLGRRSWAEQVMHAKRRLKMNTSMTSEGSQSS
jgi:heme exporter protein CcmD